MRRPIQLAATLLSALAFTACGDSESGDEPTSSTSSTPAADTTETTTSGSGAGGADCVNAWNTLGSKDVRARASLTHRGEGDADIHIGTYTAAPFTATGDAFDATGSTTSDEVTVAPGDCVAVDRTSTSDSETNWIMVLPKTTSGGKDWYFLDPGEDQPLAKAPQTLEGEQVVKIMGFGEEAQLRP